MSAAPVTTPLDASGDRLWGPIEASDHHLPAELSRLATRLVVTVSGDTAIITVLQEGLATPTAIEPTIRSGTVSARVIARIRCRCPNSEPNGRFESSHRR